MVTQWVSPKCPRFLPDGDFLFFLVSSIFLNMDTLLTITSGLTERRGLALLLTKDRARTRKTDLIASLILKGPLFLVSGDEWLPAFTLPRIIRSQTADVRRVVNRLRTVRASTCFRLFDSLATTDSQGEPILVTDFLHTFYDPDIPLRTRLFRLRECCRELKRLAFYRPVIVMVQENEGEDYEKFIPALLSVAEVSFTIEPEVEPTSQPALF